jgi:radical SAM protein with 4Fe4S-binding SPASM domain
VKKLLKELSELNVKDFRIYGGEPLLRRDIFDIIPVAREYGMQVSIYTNGMILDDEILKKIKRLEVHKIFVSLDGATPITHDRIRGCSGSFKKVIHNINRLISEGTVVDVIFTVSKLNMNEIFGVYELCHLLGVNDIKADIVSKVGRARDNWQMLSLSDSDIRRIIKDIYKCHVQYYNREPIRKKCKAGIEEMFIAANGNIYPCALLIDNKFFGGNVRESSIREIWERPQDGFYELRNILSEQKFCGDCKNKKICGGGCRARAIYNYFESLLNPDVPSCILFKEVLCINGC